MASIMYTPCSFLLFKTSISLVNGFSGLGGRSGNILPPTRIKPAELDTTPIVLADILEVVQLLLELPPAPLVLVIINCKILRMVSVSKVLYIRLLLSTTICK